MTSIKNSTTKKKYHSREEVESQVLERFPELQDNKTFHRYFSSYDFHDNERQMLEDWSHIIDYYYESIFDSLGLTVNDILSYSKMKNRNPIGLPNILIGLRLRGDYIIGSDIKDDNFYRKNFPYLFKHENTWGNYFKNSLYGMGSYALSFVYSKTDNEYQPLKGDEVFFNFDFFKRHCFENLYETLKEQCENHDNNLITVRKFKRLLLQNNIKFGDSYLDLCLLFLEKLKKIGLFEIGKGQERIQCIKLFRNEEDSITKQDEAKMDLNLQIESISKKIEEIEAKMKNCHEQSKICLKNGDREVAKNWLKREKIQLKSRNNYMNVMNMLEDNLMDLNSAENNLKVKDILCDATKALKQLMVEPDKFDELTDEIRNQGENLGEINNIITGFAEEKVDSGIDQELESLQKEIDGKNYMDYLSSQNILNPIKEKAEVKEENKQIEFPNANVAKIENNQEAGQNSNLAEKSKDDLDLILENLENS